MPAVGTVLVCGLCLCTHMPSQAAATCMLRCTCSLLGGMGRPDRSPSGPVQIGRTASDGTSHCVCVYGCGGPPSAALGNLVVNSPENQHAIAAAGGVAVVVGAMRGHPEVADVQQNGCSGA